MPSPHKADSTLEAYIGWNLKTAEQDEVTSAKLEVAE